MAHDEAKRGPNDRSRTATRLGLFTLGLCTAHCLLIIAEGAGGSLFAFGPEPDLLTGLILIFLLPLSLVRLWPMVRALRIGRRVGSVPIIYAVLIAFVCFFATTPGNLSCWRLQALGFQLHYRSIFDTWTTKVIHDPSLPETYWIKAFPTRGTQPRRGQIPIPRELDGIGREILVTGVGKGRHVAFLNGGGFGGYQFLVGGVDYRSRIGFLLWPGAYFQALDSSESYAPS